MEPAAAQSAAPGAPAVAASAAAPQSPPTLWDLPEPLMQEAVLSRLGLVELAACGCVSRAFRELSVRALAAKPAISAAADLPRLPRQHNYLLMGGGRGGSGGTASCAAPAPDRQRRRVLGQHCHALQRLHLDLPPPQVPLCAAGEAVARAAAGEAWGAAGPGALLGGVGAAAAAAEAECPPVDGYLLKLLAQCCPGLLSLRVVNITNNATMNRLLCRQLTAIVLHDCPGVSDRALVEIGEHCTQLRALDCTVARRGGGLLMMGEEPEQLGFRALFTIAANCPLLEDLCISEEGLEAPVVDDDCIICLAQGCPRLRRLALRHTGAVTDMGARAVANRCKGLRDLVLEHTAVGDAGVLALAKGLPALRSLSLANYTSNLSALLGGPRAARGVSDAALGHLAQHCRTLQHLSITGSRRVTDAGLLHLAGLSGQTAAPGWLAQLTSLTINHTAATDGAACELLARCASLQALSLRGLLYSADSMAARVAASCRHLTALDLRHCSTLSDGGLGELARLPFLRSLHRSFCVRISDAGLVLLGGGGARGGVSQPGASAAASASAAAQQKQQHPLAPPALAWSAAAVAAVPGGSLLPCAVAGGSLLRELELYHCPQVTHRGIWSLAEACPELQHLNIGKCRLVKVECLGGLLERRTALHLSTCHYLDS